jgi:hypothetical protein
VSESCGIDSGSGGTKSMPKPYSDDLRERVIEAVAAGAAGSGRKLQPERQFRGEVVAALA